MIAIQVVLRRSDDRQTRNYVVLLTDRLWKMAAVKLYLPPKNHSDESHFEYLYLNHARLFQRKLQT